MHREGKTPTIDRPLLTPGSRILPGVWFARRYTGILALAAVLVLGQGVRAATLRIWDGSASADWSNGQNWQNNAKPDTPGEVAIFSSTQVNNPVNGNLTCTIGRLKVSRGGWDINDGGGVVTIVGDDGTGSKAVEQTVSGYTDIYIDIVQGRDDLEWSVASGGVLKMHGGVSGAAVKKTGSGLLRFYGTNTYSGLTTITGGTLQLGAGGCIPDDSVVWVNGTSVTFDLNNNNETVAGINRNGVVDLGSGTLTINVGTGESYNLWAAGSIIGTGDLIKTGAGTQIITGTNTYSGATTVSNGTLLINGSHIGGNAYTVAGGSLGGKGSLDAPVTVGGAGRIAPGATAGSSVAEMTVGGLVLEGRLSIEIGGPVQSTQYDRLAVSGSVTIDSATAVLDAGLLGGFSPLGADAYVILANDGVDAISGTFKDAPEGATVTVGTMPMSISYTGGDGNDITLAVSDSGTLIIVR